MLASFPATTCLGMLIQSAHELAILQDGRTVGAIPLSRAQCDAIRNALASPHSPLPLADFRKVLHAIPVAKSAVPPPKRSDIMRFGRC